MKDMKQWGATYIVVIAVTMFFAAIALGVRLLAEMAGLIYPG